MEKESLEDLTGDSGQNQAGKRGGNPLQDGGGAGDQKPFPQEPAWERLRKGNWPRC